MSSRNKNINLTSQQLESLGFVKDSSGGYVRPRGKVEIGPNKDHTLFLKQVVNPTKDFEVRPTTEWFIKNYNVPSKKNSRQNFIRNGKQISIPSKNHAEYVKMTAIQYAVFGKEFRAAVEFYKLVNPLYVQFTFIRGSQHRFDFTNCAQTVEDLMVDNNWIDDDSADHIIPVFVPYEYDKNCPGVKIKLFIK